MEEPEVDSGTWCLLNLKGEIVMMFGLPQMFCTKEEAEAQQQYIWWKYRKKFRVKKIRLG